jgi:hypothetical protein
MQHVWREPELARNSGLKTRDFGETSEGPIGLMRFDHDLAAVNELQPGYCANARAIKKRLARSRAQFASTKVIESTRDTAGIAEPVNRHLHVRKILLGEVRSDRRDDIIVHSGGAPE